MSNKKGRPSREDSRRKNVDEIKAKMRKNNGPRLATDVSHHFDDHEEYRYRWHNNEQGRIEKAEREGWEVVRGKGSTDGVYRPDADKSTSETSVMRMPVGLLKTQDAGEAILMKIHVDNFQALCEIKEERRKDMDRALKGGAAGAEGNDVQGVQTYAAETSNGNRGFDVQHEN